jgi:hypothetical protein
MSNRNLNNTQENEIKFSSVAEARSRIEKSLADFSRTHRGSLELQCDFSDECSTLLYLYENDPEGQVELIKQFISRFSAFHAMGTVIANEQFSAIESWLSECDMRVIKMIYYIYRNSPEFDRICFTNIFLLQCGCVHEKSIQNTAFSNAYLLQISEKNCHRQFHKNQKNLRKMLKFYYTIFGIPFCRKMLDYFTSDRYSSKRCDQRTPFMWSLFVSILSFEDKKVLGLLENDLLLSFKRKEPTPPTNNDDNDDETDNSANDDNETIVDSKRLRTESPKEIVEPVKEEKL